MAHLNINQNNFSGGEIAGEYFGRTDLNLHAAGMKTLKNVDILPSGALRKRPGLEFVMSLPADVRVHKFIHSEKNFLLILSPGRLQILDIATGKIEQTITRYKHFDIVDSQTFPESYKTIPWKKSQLDELRFAQSAEFLIICHSDFAPIKLFYDASASQGNRFRLQAWMAADSVNSVNLLPFANFRKEKILLRITNEAHQAIVASEDYEFDESWIGEILKFPNGTIVLCTEEHDSNTTRIKCLLLTNKRDYIKTAHWQELAFSDALGWPRTACFHQGRFIFASTNAAPATLWMSHVGNYDNFALGENNDEAIQVTLRSTGNAPVRHMISSRHLQIFTGDGEWVIDKDIITPTDIGISLRTRIGAHANAKLTPIVVGGATVFCAEADGALHEHIFNGVENTYSANNLNSLARHFDAPPISMSYDADNKRFFCIMPNGTIRVLALYDQEKIIAWSHYLTETGHFKDMINAGGDNYAVIEKIFGTTRNYLKKLSPHRTNDHDTSLTNYRQVDVLIEALPPVLSLRGTHDRYRLLEATFHTEDTQNFSVNFGDGYKTYSGYANSDNYIVLASDTQEHKKIKFKNIGWHDVGQKPLWTLKHQQLQPLTLLGVETRLSVN